jgi:hypothetical protein
VKGEDPGASARARLLNKAKTETQDFSLVLTRYAHFDGETLHQAIRVTFDRRATHILAGVPFGLTDLWRVRRVSSGMVHCARQRPAPLGCCASWYASSGSGERIPELQFARQVL